MVRKSGIATILSLLIAGLGQIYLGKVLQGLIWLTILIVAIILSTYPLSLVGNFSSNYSITKLLSIPDFSIWAEAILINILSAIQAYRLKKV